MLRSQIELLGYDYTDEQIDQICRLYIDMAFKGYCENITHMDGYYWYAAYLDHRFTDYFDAGNDIWDQVNANIDEDHAGAERIDINAQKISYKVDFDQDGNVYLDITEGMDNVLSVETNLVYFSYSGYQFYTFMGVKALDITEGSSSFTYSFDNMWVSANGVAVGVFIIEDTDNYTTYAIPADINGEWSYLFFQLDKESGEYSILYAVHASTMDGVASNEMFSLAEGDEITPYYFALVYESLSNDVPMGVYVRDFGNPIVYDGTCFFSEGQLFHNGFDNKECVLINFVIKDAFGNTYCTDSVAIYLDQDLQVKEVHNAADDDFKDYGDIYSFYGEDYSG